MAKQNNNPKPVVKPTQRPKPLTEGQTINDRPTIRPKK
jgi:hypothetical protein